MICRLLRKLQGECANATSGLHALGGGSASPISLNAQRILVAVAEACAGPTKSPPLGVIRSSRS